MKERDTQRQKLYRAEREALVPIETRLETVNNVRQYLKRNSTKAALTKRYGHTMDVSAWELEVADGRGTRNALAYGSYRINIPLWARCDRVVLHEWAHIIHNRITEYWYLKDIRTASRAEELKGGAAHGWQFATIYLDLVHFCMGQEASNVLKASYKKHRVRIRPKATRTLTPADRDRLVKQIEVARAARKKDV